MTGLSRAPTRSDTQTRRRGPARSQHDRSPAELIFFAVTGHDPSIRMERGVRFIRLMTNVALYIAMLAAKELAKGLLRRR